MAIPSIYQYRGIRWNNNIYKIVVVSGGSFRRYR